MRNKEKDVSKISTILVLLMCFSSTCESLKVLGIFPVHGKSHFVISESLMKGLAEKGHEVDVYSHFPLKKPVPNHRDFSLAGTLPALVNNRSYNEFGTVNFKQIHKMAGESICDLMKHSVFQELFKTTKKYDVVIVEVK